MQLDRLIHRIVREPALLDEVALTTSQCLGAGVSLHEIRRLLDRDLSGLRACGVHPLLLMQFADTFRIEPMVMLGRQPLPSRGHE